MTALLSPRTWLALAILAMFAAINFASYRAGKAAIRAEWNVEKLATAAAVLKAAEAARAREQQLQATVTKAQNDAKQRETKLQAVADTAGRSAASLRDQLASINRSLPGLATDAVGRYATAANTALSECSERYTALASTADRLANDKQALIEAWPK